MKQFSRRKKILITASVVILLWSTIFFMLGKKYQEHQYNQKHAKAEQLVSGVKSTSISSGTVTKISSKAIELKDLQNTTKTYSVSGETSITKGGKKITLHEVKINDKIRIIPQQSDGSQARQILVIVSQ